MVSDSTKISWFSMLMSILLIRNNEKVQLPSPNTGVISLPIHWSFYWSDISFDDKTDPVSTHVGFF